MEIPSLEVYIGGTEHPALYDYLVSSEGRLIPMHPFPPRAGGGLIQVVLESGIRTPTAEQVAALNGLIVDNNAVVHYHFRYLIPT